MPSASSVPLLTQLTKSDTTTAALDLSGNDFSDQMMDHVCESLKVNGTIRELALSGNAIGGPGGMAVAEMLQSNTALVRLEMGNCGLSTESLVALATVLRDNVTLQALDVSRPLARTVMDEPAAHFARMLKVNATLRDLDLSKAGLRDFGLQLLAEELYRAGAQSGLRRLGLRCNQLELSDDSCAQALHNLLGSDVCQLQVLDLGGNRLHDYGAHRLAEMIGDNVSLRSLDVSSNGLMSRGLCAIAHYTGARAPGELELNLWGNHFDTAAASKFEKHPCAFDFKVQLVDGTYHTVQAN